MKRNAQRRKRPEPGAAPPVGSGPLAWQERHSPTDAVIPDGDALAGRTGRQVRRRRPDARFWGQLETDRQRAAERIASGHGLFHDGAPVRTIGYVRTAAGTAPLEDWALKRIRDYRSWVKAATAEGCAVTAVIDYLVDGRGLTSIDRRHRRRNGWARDTVLQGLDIFCRNRGWR